MPLSGKVMLTGYFVDRSVQATFGVNGAAPTHPNSAAFATYYGNYHGTYEPLLCQPRRGRCSTSCGNKGGQKEGARGRFPFMPPDQKRSCIRLYAYSPNLRCAGGLG